jgi:hypothetical protein
MTPAQRNGCVGVLARLRPDTVHHGDAVGADAEFHDLARAIGARIVVHPATVRAHRAFRVGDESRSPTAKTARDRAVVDASDLLIAAPADPDDEGPESGTWYTIQYAVWAGKSIVVLWPDGTEETGPSLAQ